MKIYQKARQQDAKACMKVQQLGRFTYKTSLELFWTVQANWVLLDEETFMNDVTHIGGGCHANFENFHPPPSLSR